MGRGSARPGKSQGTEKLLRRDETDLSQNTPCLLFFL